MSGGIWAPFKELASVVNQAILKKQPEAFYSLEAILKKHKTDFISLLKNPVRLRSIRASTLSLLLVYRAYVYCVCV